MYGFAKSPEILIHIRLFVTPCIGQIHGIIYPPAHSPFPGGKAMIHTAGGFQGRK